MKLLTLLPLAAITTAFVIPDEALTSQINGQVNEESKSFLERLPSKDSIISHIEATIDSSLTFSAKTIDNALAAASEVRQKIPCYKSMTAFDMQGWLESASNSLPFNEFNPTQKNPHRGKPHHDKPTQTVYEIINSSKYTTKLAKLINEYDDLVELLNGTSTNFTVFAPTDQAFEHIPHGDKKPSKEIIKKILTYHVSQDFYPAGRVLVSATIPTAYKEEGLGGEAQRLRLGLSLKGLTVNFYSHIVAVNIFGTNGVIHGVDSILLPPPPALKIISLLPGEFSTLQLALTKTGLDTEIEKSAHTGGTFFAPSNFAFQKLGPRINAFLFSSHGLKYLKALLKYHIVANQTLYSDAFYHAADKETNTEDIPKGVFHVDLPTLLEDKSLSIDVARYGGLINIRINGYNDVAIKDGLAKDGVIQVPRNVLIPPKAVGGLEYDGGELEVEDLIERLGSLVEEDAREQNGEEL